MLEKCYKVKYNAYGTVVIESVIAGSLNIQTDVMRVQSKKAGLYKAIAKKLGRNVTAVDIISVALEYGIKPVIKEKDLPIVLMSLYSAELTGGNIIDALAGVMSGIYNDDNINSKIKHYKADGVSISDILKRFFVNTVVVALIKSADQSSNRAAALESAINYLELENKTKEAAKTGLGLSLLYLLSGVILSLLFPVFAADFLNDLIKQLDAPSTAIIAYLTFVANNIFIIVGALLSIIAIFAYVFFSGKANHLPVFNIFYKISILKKVIVFMPFYSTLNAAGVNDKSIVQNYRNIDTNIADKILESIAIGKDLPQSLKQSGFPASAANGMSTAIKIENLEARQKAFTGLMKRFSAEILHYGQKIAGIFKIVGYLSLSSVIIMMIFTYETLLNAGLQAA